MSKRSGNHYKYFEIQLLERFGVRPEWHHCVACGETQGKFDYSSKYSGVLCENIGI